jgi:GH43 family beta-xylosidase
MFVLESSGPSPWDSSYTTISELDTYNQFAIDGTYFLDATTKQLYHIYSCWEGAYISWPSMLCISQMSSPTSVSSSLAQRAIISRPDQPWEKTPYNRTVNERLSSNEGPQQLTNPTTGQQFVIYSAARSDNRNYCLGQLELKANADPMDPASWIKYTAGCVFEQNPDQQVYGVGHASFTTSPDGTEDWIVYHGMKNYLEGWSARTIRAQKFTWNEDGTPNFPKPGLGPYPVPSGQMGGSASGSAGTSSPGPSTFATTTVVASTLGATSAYSDLWGASNSYQPWETV